MKELCTRASGQERHFGRSPACRFCWNVKKETIKNMDTFIQQIINGLVL
ncbi:MAG: hypothetical protein JWR40_2079, partial [Massilia sp.]|nr:hypothetical protein [Massilia sp.]